MGDDFRSLAIRQGASTAAGFLSSRIRNRTRQVELVETKEPERPALREAERLVGRRGQLLTAEETTVEETEMLESGPILVPDDFFDSVEARENEKSVLRSALASPQPVHVLLVGDPGCGKSQLLSCIAKLPDSRYAVGGATTSSGLTGYLLERPNTRILIIDELDKADQADLYQLYSLMESGMVTRLQHRATEQIQRKVWVMAAANQADQLPDALRSRFVRIDIPSYTPDQIREITAAVLVKREGVEPARAREIANAVAQRSRDPRDGIQISRLAGASGPIGPVVDQVLPKKRAGGS